MAHWAINIALLTECGAMNLDLVFVNSGPKTAPSWLRPLRGPDIVYSGNLSIGRRYAATGPIGSSGSNQMRRSREM